MIDIARIAQVSESAVSRALHDHPRISLETRDRIKKIAAEMEFDFNSHAQSLSTSKSGTVGVIVPNFGADARRTYYLDLLISDIRTQLGASGYDLLVADSSHSGQGGSNLRRLVLQRKIDGLVLIIGELHDVDRQVLRNRKIAVVMVNSKPLPMVDQSVDEFPCVFTDNLAGGRLAADHLVAQGCTKLICLADEVAGPEMLDRTVGFSQGLEASGLEPEVFRIPSDFESVFSFVKDHLPVFRHVDGVFCHTDVMACATLRALQEGGVRVPQDVRVVGYDDIELGTYFAPRLTTIHQPREEIARLACQQLVARMLDPQREAPAHLSVPPSLVVRESA